MTDTFHLDWCTYPAARYAVTHWHYSRAMPTPPLVRIGVWEHGRFIGVILFGRGATNHLGSPYGLRVGEVCELTRVALDDHEAPVSQIVPRAVTMMHRANPKLRLIVSFADPEQGHAGKIYQAMNWIYAGQSESYDKFQTPDGRIWHPRQVSATGYKRQYGTMRRVPKISECKRIPVAGKHRYLWPLDRQMRRVAESFRQPYPKVP